MTMQNLQMHVNPRGTANGILWVKLRESASLFPILQPRHFLRCPFMMGERDPSSFYPPNYIQIVYLYFVVVATVFLSRSSRPFGDDFFFCSNYWWRLDKLRYHTIYFSTFLRQNLLPLNATHILDLVAFKIIIKSMFNNNLSKIS